MEITGDIAESRKESFATNDHRHSSTSSYQKLISKSESILERASSVHGIPQESQTLFEWSEVNLYVPTKKSAERNDKPIDP